MRTKILFAFFLVLIVLLSSLLFSSVHSATLFSDGFESGSYSAWTGTVVSSGATLAVSSAQAHSGTYSSHSITNSTASNAYPYYTFSALTTVYMRAYIYIVSESGMGYQTLACLNFGSIYLDLSGVAIVHSYGVDCIGLSWYDSGGNHLAASSRVAPIGAWHCYEFMYRQDASVGEVALWMDGTLLLDETGLNTSGHAVTQAYGGQGGFSYIGTGGSVETYTDDVVVSDSYIGPQPTVPPSVTVLSPQNMTYSTSDVPLTFTVNETASWMGYSLDGQGNVTVSGNTTLTGLLDGSHQVIVYANDTYGNMGSSGPVYFTVQTVPPSILVLSPENTTYNTPDVPLTFTVNETASWMGYSLDGQGNVTVSGNTTLTGLAYGTHSIIVYANDTFGSMGTSSITYFTVTQPALNMTPTAETCREYDENFTVEVNASNIFNVTGFEFEVDFNTTLLNCSNIVWNAWGSGSVTVDEAGGTITGYTSGTAINGAQTLIIIEFTADYQRIWKNIPGWINDQSGLILIQAANLTYPSAPKLQYVQGGPGEIAVGAGVTCTFSPIQGDVNNDGTVNIIDLRTLAAFYDVKQGDPTWPEASAYDLNGDGIIDIYDLVLIATNWGYTYTP
jgi:hypothetical protein